MKNVEQQKSRVRLSPYLKNVVKYLSMKLNTSQHSIIIMALNEYSEKHLTEEERKQLNK